jgi:hypothetical protein
MVTRFLLALALFSAPPAVAAPTVLEATLDANGLPIVQLSIKGQAVRLAIEPALGGYASLNKSSAERLKVRPVPLVRAAVSMDDAQISGRVTRQSMKLGQNSETSWFGLFTPDALPGVAGVDGIAGLEALPADIVMIKLAESAAGSATRTISFIPLKDQPGYYAAQLDGQDVRLTFHFFHPETNINRPLSQDLTQNRLLSPTGEHRKTRWYFGLEVPMQPMQAQDWTIQGLAPGPILARSKAPLVVPDAEAMDIIVTSKDDEAPKPTLSLGRAALAGCTQMLYERKSRALTLTCPAR